VKGDRAVEPSESRGSAYDLFTRLVRFQTQVWNEVDERVRAGVGVPLTDLTALDLVATVAGCRVQDLVSTLHITVGGASKVVDRLESAGLVRRSPNPDDRRSSLLSVTIKGRRLLERAEPHLDAVLGARITAALSPTDAAHLDRILRRLQDPTRSTTEVS